MNWRTLLWWWFIMLCLSQLPTSLLDANCTNVFQNIAFAVGAITGMFWLIKWAWQKYKEKHSYIVRFRRENHGLSEITEIQTVLIGIHHLDVMIKATHGVSIEHADIRFVIDKLHRQHPRSDANRDDIEITYAMDLDIRAPRFSYAVGNDQAGGVDLNYSPPYRRVRGQFVRVQIAVQAKREWEGYISFCESKVYAYYPFRVVKALDDSK
jgi:hypothetical protein